MTGAWVRRLTEIEGGRWAWVREDLLQAAPVSDLPAGWCSLNERGCRGECQGELCMAVRQARTESEDR